VASARRLQGQEACAKCAFVPGPIRPKSPSWLPNCSQTFVVRHSVLDDDGLDLVRKGEGHAKTHRAAVILHVERVARQPECSSEVTYDLGAMIEGV